MNSQEIDIVEVAYQPRAAGLPVETFSLSSLMQRRSRSELTSRQRLDFEMLVCCTAGSGHHEIDFELVDIAPGRILHIRPGQVHRWILDSLYEAELILLRPLDNRRSWRPGPHIIATDPELDSDLESVLRIVNRAAGSTQLPIRGLEAIRDLLVALLQLDDHYQAESNHQESIYSDFERLLGEAEIPPRTVHGCAQRLGCSTRTLARACHAAVGVAPKTLIDQAIALEAQRRLSVSSSSATEVAEALGFAELSHFSRFFARVTGETPSAFATSFAIGG